MVLMVGAGDSRYVLLHGHGGRTLPVSSYTMFRMETERDKDYNQDQSRDCQRFVR